MRTLKLISSLFLFTSFGCNYIQTDNGTSTNDDSIYLNLPDSLFAFKNLQNSTIISQLDWDGFTDRTKTKKLKRIDSLTVVKLLCPVNVIKPGEYSYFMTSFYYISKQPKIGDIQPIVIWGTGDDYSDLMLLTLDKKGTPIDFYTLHKQDCSGTFSIEDSLMGICPIQHSVINSDKIKTYVNKISFKLDSTKSPTNFARIDSIAFEAIISPSGKINSKQVDSVRYHRTYKL